MPIPFRDLGEDGPSGLAAYLRFIDEPDGKGVRGALFVMSTRGEPLEFSFTRIDVPSGVLWRPGRAKSRAVSLLAKSLFESVSRLPDVVLALARETPPTVFSEEVEAQAPLCRVAMEDSQPMAPSEEAQPLSAALTLYWTNGLPLPGGTPARTVDLLVNHGLLVEPFERAALGIQEAFEA